MIFNTITTTVSFLEDKVTKEEHDQKNYSKYYSNNTAAAMSYSTKKAHSNFS